MGVVTRGSIMSVLLVTLLSTVLLRCASGLQCLDNLRDPTVRSPPLTFQDPLGNPYTFCQQFYLQAGMANNVTFFGWVYSGSTTAHNQHDCILQVQQYFGAVTSEFGSNFYVTRNSGCCRTDGCNAMGQ